MQAYRLPIRLPSYKNCLGLMLLCLLLTILDILVVETFYRPVCHTSEDWQIMEMACYLQIFNSDAAFTCSH
jgi:hypothetical protein